MAEAAVLQDSSMLANHFLTRDGRIRTGDPLNPIRAHDGPNVSKKPHKPLVRRLARARAVPWARPPRSLHSSTTHRLR